MDDTNLEKLITESTARLEAEQATAKTKAEAEINEYQELLAKATEQRLAEIASDIPPGRARPHFPRHRFHAEVYCNPRG
jgi:hypothetical protein